MKTHSNGIAGTQTRPASKAKMEVVEAFGRVAQLIGLPRSTGQIYGLLQFSVEPLCLDDIASILDLSKGSCSTGTRELCSLRAIRQVWVPGDRKDFFQVEPDLASVLKAAYEEFVVPRVASSKQRLEQLEASLDSDLKSGAIPAAEHKVLVDRVKEFMRVQKKAQTLAGLASKAF